MRRANGATGAVWPLCRDGAAELWFTGGRERCRATPTLHRWPPGQLSSEADESVHSADAYPLPPVVPEDLRRDLVPAILPDYDRKSHRSPVKVHRYRLVVPKGHGQVLVSLLDPPVGRGGRPSAE